MNDFLPPRFAAYARLYTALVGGAFLFATGIIGYDTGRRWSTAEVPEKTRWIGEPIWIQMAIGMAMLVYGVYAYRKLRNAKSVEPANPN
jgi:hypothetical protein